MATAISPLHPLFTNPNIRPASSPSSAIHLTPNTEFPIVPFRSSFLSPPCRRPFPSFKRSRCSHGSRSSAAMAPSPAASAVGTTAAPSAAESLIPWLTSNGFPEPWVSVESAGDAGFGCFAKRPIKAGEDLLRVPENFTVSSVDVANHPVIASAAQGRDELVGLSLWLLYEKAQPTSPWRPFLQVFPETTLSPLLWTPEECEQLLQGSPLLAEVKERVRILEAEFEGLKKSHFDLSPENFPKDVFTLEAFKRAFAVVLSRVIYLPTVDILALIPLADMVNHLPGCKSTVDFRLEDNTIALAADRDYSPGDQIFCSYGSERTNADLLINYGFVAENNPSDVFELTVGLVPADRLFGMKKGLVEEAGFAAKQSFPLFPDRLPTQLLSYTRLARIQDPALFTKVTFDRDAMINESNEYEVLMLLTAECRDALAGYAGGLEDDLRAVKGKNLPAKEKVAARLRIGEKTILTGAMAALRSRLAPIRGIPSKGGQMQDPNSDIKEMFGVMEAGLSAPKRFFSQIFDKSKQ